MNKKINGLLYSTSALLAIMTFNHTVAAEEIEEVEEFENKASNIDPIEKDFELSYELVGDKISGNISNPYKLFILDELGKASEIATDENGSFELYIENYLDSTILTLEVRDLDGGIVYNEEVGNLNNTKVQEEPVEQQLMSVSSTQKVDVEQIDGKTAYIVNSKDVKSDEPISYIIDRLNKELKIVVTEDELMTWNEINDKNDLKINDVLFIDGYIPERFKKSDSKPYSNSSEFLKFAAPFAEEVASENNIYASVMIAQAIKETGWGTSDISQPPFHNLFGIKAGSKDEYSVIKETSEVIEGKEIRVLAPFKIFDSYLEGFSENANKLRNGTYWNNNFYSGTWIENANKYSDATHWLTGRYATDPNYYIGLNKIIEDYSLTEYDTHPVDSINSIRDIDHTFVMRKPYYTIDTKPYRTEGFETVGYTTKHLNNTVTAIKEAKTSAGTYLLIQKDGIELGWVSEEALELPELNAVSVSYSAKIIGNNHNIYSKPAGTYGAVRIAFSDTLTGTAVDVVSEKILNNETYALIKINGETLGWLNIKGLNENFVEVSSSQKVDFKAVIKGNGHNIFSSPVGTTGSFKVYWTSHYKGIEVNVVEEAETVNGKYYKVSLDSNDMGWIHENGVSESNLEIIESTAVAYKAILANDGHDIHSAPENTDGSKKVLNTSDYLGSEIKVYMEKTTSAGTYARINIDGVNGWINVNGLEKSYAKTLNNKSVAYHASIRGNGHNIYSEPAWSEGNERIAFSNDFKGKPLIITSEKITEEGVFARVLVDGSIGWIHESGLNKDYTEVTDSKSVVYTATLSGNGHNIFSTPAWSEGSERIAWASDFKDVEILVSNVKVTENGNYAKVNIDGMLGWIHESGLNKNYTEILEARNVNYTANIKGNSHNIFSTPAWSAGNERIAWSSDYKNVKVTVDSEKLTENGVYSKINLDGVVGWIHESGLSKDLTELISSRNVAYTATVDGNGHNIFSSPVGLSDSKRVAWSSSYKGFKIKVYNEKITDKGSYAEVNIDGVTGWINTQGITKNYLPIIERNAVQYEGTIRGDGNNIYSQPAWSKDNQLMHRSSDLRGENIFIKEEVFTAEGKFYLAASNGKSLGWIKQAGVNLAKPLVYLDAGHGGIDSGARSNGYYEKDINLKVALKIEKLLKDKGYYVIMSRTDDSSLTMPERMVDANRHNPELFVSIHQNAFNGVAEGIETFYYNQNGDTENDKANDPTRIERSKVAAELIQKELLKETGAVDRGVKKANFHVLRETRVPAALFEGGFLDNSADRAKLLLDSYQDKLAKAVSTAISGFFNIFR